MRILRHPDHVAEDLAAALTANGLFYGAEEAYSGLITPSSCVLDAAETAAITADLALLWQFYRTLNDLYRAALRGEAPRWIADRCEYGLRPEEIQAQRITLAAGLTPRLCRVDYIALHPQRVVSEVQWKSGGPGLFFGIHDVCATAAPGADARPGNPVEGLRATIMNCDGAEPVAVNPARSVWLPGERYLRRALDRQGMRYIAFERGEGPRRIIERGGGFRVVEGASLLPVNFLYGQELLPALAPPTLVRLARAAAEGKLWMETPLNYVYRQKWGMALPFMPAFAHAFDDRLRALFGAVALLHGEQVDLRPLAEGLPDNLARQLRAVGVLDELADLSTAARRLLVLKCGSGSGPYHSQGRGVLRLNGSRSAARKTLAFVRERLLQGEPWIVQRYVDATVSLDVSPPWAPLELRRIDAHARLMVYAAFDSQGTPRIIGGLGNFSSNWKVSGKSARRDERGRVVGAAFNDLRFG